MTTFANPNNGNENSGSGGGNISNITPSFPTTIGNLGILAFSYDHGSPISSVTGGGTWARIGTNQNDAGNNQDATWWWTIFTSSVSLLNFSNIPGAAVTYAEFSCDAGFAASPLDVQNTAKAFGSTTTATDALTSNPITLSNLNAVTGTYTINKTGDSYTVQIAAFKALTGTDELVIVAGYDQSGTGPTWTNGTGYTAAIAEPGLAGFTGSSAIEWKKSSPIIVTTANINKAEVFQ